MELSMCNDLFQLINVWGLEINNVVALDVVLHVPNIDTQLV